MPHVGLSSDEVEEQYPSLQVADDLELEDLSRLEGDRLYDVRMSVIRHILHEMAVEGRTRRAGSAIQEEPLAQALSKAHAAQSDKASMRIPQR